MKKLLSISLAMLLLATASPTSQGIRTLVKMGEFVHHFIHHVVCDQEQLGIGGYLKLHYSDHEHHEADHHEHENLPFSHHDDQQGTTLQTLLLLQHQSESLTLSRPDFDIMPLNPLTGRWHSTSYLHDIWQPPRA
jgi:hypothetical protein